MNEKKWGHRSHESQNNNHLNEKAGSLRDNPPPKKKEKKKSRKIVRLACAHASDTSSTPPYYTTNVVLVLATRQGPQTPENGLKGSWNFPSSVSPSLYIKRIPNNDITPYYWNHLLDPIYIGNMQGFGCFSARCHCLMVASRIHESSFAVGKKARK